MNNTVKSWEFWTLVGVAVVFLYLLYIAFQAANGLVQTVTAPIVAGEQAASGFFAWLQGLFSAQPTGTDASQPQSAQ